MSTNARQIIAAMLLGTVALVAQPAFAADKKADAAASAPKLSKPVQALLIEAQKLDQAGSYAAALAKVREAEALPNPTPNDTFTIAQFKLNIAIGMRKAEPQTPPSTTPQSLSPGNALLEEGLSGLVASPLTTPADVQKYLPNLSILALQRGDYNAATKWQEQLVAATPTDPAALDRLSALYQQQKLFPKAIETRNRAIAAKKAAGQTVEENWYRDALAMAYNNKLADQTQAASIALVAAYPQPKSYNTVLHLVQQSAKLDDQGNLDLLRLMFATGALAGEKDYFEYAETASIRGLPGEAKAALTAGRAAGFIDDKKKYVVDLQKNVDAKVAADRASLPGLDRDARNAATGRPALGTADAWFGYGDYGKAADLYRIALTKGGIDADTANLRLGAALARSGDKAGATAALANVHGARAPIARYWTLWLARA